MFNPELDIEYLSAEFQRDDRIRIANILDGKLAEAVASCCESQVPFDFIYHVDGENRVSSSREMAAMDAGSRQALMQKLSQAASRGVGFLYGGYMMNRPGHRAGAELQSLYQLYDFLGSEAGLATMRSITGIEELAGIDAQFTRYTSGHFLTRHSDDITDRGRRIAFVFSLSRVWHPDWGGLLQFFDNDGTPRDSWLPAFNTLALFDVRHVHSVTYVTPFAQAPRLSFTGWFTTASSA